MSAESASKRKSKARKRPDASASRPRCEWELRLYVAGQTPGSIAALSNLTQICEEYLQGKYRLQVIDLLVDPQLGRDDQILAIPTLVRELPVPLRKIIGDLSNTAQTLVGLQLKPGPAPAAKKPRA